VIIKLDDVSGPEIQELLREHLEFAAQHSPPESIHALDVAGLKQRNISFWTAWEDAELLGCGALKELDERHGEIKVDAHVDPASSKRRGLTSLKPSNRRGAASRLHASEFRNRIKWQPLRLHARSIPDLDLFTANRLRITSRIPIACS